MSKSPKTTNFGQFEEYSALRSEITSRVAKIFEMGATAATFLLTVWLAGITLYVGIQSKSGKILFLPYFICIVAMFLIYISVSIGLSNKVQENLRQIAVISAFLDVVYENDTTGFFWEKIQYDPIVDLGNLTRKKKPIHYYMDIQLLALSSFIVCFINWIFLFDKFGKFDMGLNTLLPMLIFLAIASFSVVLVMFFIIPPKVSVKKNIGDVREESKIQVKFFYDSKCEENKPKSEIPKVIHYIWVGKNEMIDFDKYYESWKSNSKGYKIRKWTLDDFDSNELPLYVKQAYENGKYAFVSDYLRLKILFDNGGIYLDTDVMLKSSLEDFRTRYCGFIGFDFDGNQLGTACFGVEKENTIIKEIMELYEKLSFIDSESDEQPNFFLLANTFIYTSVFLKRGLIPNNKLQFVDGVAIFPKEYFCANDFPMKKSDIFQWAFKSAKKNKNSFAIHDFKLTWMNGHKDYYTKNESKWVERINDLMGLCEEKRMKSNF